VSELQQKAGQDALVQLDPLEVEKYLQAAKLSPHDLVYRLALGGLSTRCRKLFRNRTAELIVQFPTDELALITAQADPSRPSWSLRLGIAQHTIAVFRYQDAGSLAGSAFQDKSKPPLEL
jgi:hypothetical protein